MQHVNSIDSLSLDDCELTIGSFDGVHLGHRQLIARMLTAARSAGRPTAVLSFFPHPSVVLRGWKPAFYLNSPDDKARILAELGVDYVINQTFDAELSRRSAADFLDWIGARLHPSGLWVGPDFALGYRREGDIAYLGRAASERGFELHVVEPLVLAGEVVSSTRIRQALWAGEVGWARVLLGEAFSLPVRPQPKQAPAPGVWAAWSEVSEDRACPQAGWYAARLILAGDGIPVLAHVVQAPVEGGPIAPSVIDLMAESGPQLPGEAGRLAFIDHWPQDELPGPDPSPHAIASALARLAVSSPDDPSGQPAG
jgi:riboflavin kinase / FMN adenylyltransferase